MTTKTIPSGLFKFTSPILQFGHGKSKSYAEEINLFYKLPVDFLNPWLGWVYHNVSTKNLIDLLPFKMVKQGSTFKIVSALRYISAITLQSMLIIEYR